MTIIFWLQVNSAMITHLDIVPTVLDWFQIDYPRYKIFHKQLPVKLTGRSLLPLLSSESGDDREAIYCSHSLHEITMYYPSRAVRTKQYKLIHNLNHLMPFPIDQDFYLSPTFTDMLNRTRNSVPLNWYKSSLLQYYYRDEWELFDLNRDSKEMVNLASNLEYFSIRKQLESILKQWQNITNDPWLCAPGRVLEDGGLYKDNPQCMSLLNNFN